MEYDPSDGLKEHGLQKRRPDRVFGLSRAKSMDGYLKAEAFKDLRHSPFPNSEMLYPFLILEAKSGVGGTGFEAIETQTAFPIRTCLKLQQDLRQRSGVPLDPLLWFLSFQGDEWRVAACVINNNRYVSSPGELKHFPRNSNDCTSANI